MATPLGMTSRSTLPMTPTCHLLVLGPIASSSERPQGQLLGTPGMSTLETGRLFWRRQVALGPSLTATRDRGLNC